MVEVQYKHLYKKTFVTKVVYIKPNFHIRFVIFHKKARICNKFIILIKKLQLPDYIQKRTCICDLYTKFNFSREHIEIMVNFGEMDTQSGYFRKNFET